MSTPALLETRNLTANIAGKNICRDFNFVLRPGNCIAVLGSNGVGKTTLLHSLAGLRPIDQGEIFMRGVPLNALPRRQIAQQLGLLMQQQEDSLPATVLETALIGRHPHIDFWRWESHNDVNLARRALKLVGLDGLEQRAQNQLSGGERRRLAIATIVTQDPQIFLLDEPTHQLDPHHQLALLAHFSSLARTHNRAVIMSLHDANLAVRFCDQLLMLFGDGEMLFGGLDEIVNSENLSRLYQVPVIPIKWPGGTVYLPK
jgi:iron complex transport system ATP-binding protein